MRKATGIGVRWFSQAGIAPSLAWLALVQAGCSGNTPKATKTEPAKVAQVAKEEDLNTIDLTPEAEKRLGMRIATVKSEAVEQLRSYGAEITVPPGGSIVVSAPISGTLEPPGSPAPKVGDNVVRKQVVFKLLPLLSPERAVLTPSERVRFAEAKSTLAQARIDAAGQVEQANVQVEAAQIALDRAQRLLRERAGTARAVDDAEAQLKLAQKTLEAAESREELLKGITLDEEAGTLTPLMLESPQDGMLRAQHAAAGEVVTMGAPLFEVLDYDPLWVKVPVYVGEAGEIADNRPAQISSIGAIATKKIEAAIVKAPPTAAALSATVDFYFVLDNPQAKFRPGERVNAQLELRQKRKARKIPSSAVVRDIQGGEWVYEQTAPHRFVRRRVQVEYVAGGTAVLSKGPSEGAKIATAGVMELFGAEFGFAK